jgi:hypothetical protein
MTNEISPQSRPPELIVIFTTYDVTEAYIVAGRLQSEGIPALVHKEPAGTAIGLTVGTLGEAKVLVDSRDYERALDLLESEPHDELAADNEQIVFGDDEDTFYDPHSQDFLDDDDE